MKDKSWGYNITFSINGVSMKEQQEVYDLLRKNLSFDVKDHLQIVVIDPIGGKHDVWDNKGYMPDGFFCKKCNGINCQFCPRYKGDKNGK